jgi:riboflavin kinase/FMN adenylyltransferase
LTSFEEKVAVFKELKVDNLLVLNFTESFSQLPSDVFFKEYVIDKIGLSEIVVGHDHKFGKARGGDETLLMELGNQYNFSVTRVDGVTIDDLTVSSTKIRNFLYEGNIKAANMMLGRPFSLKGRVVEGDKRGRTLGFPTANVDIVDENKLIPATGVYSVEVILKSEKYKGVMNIGRRPTFHNSSDVIVKEVHLIDFNSDIYGEEIRIYLVDRIREEKKFESKDELIRQIFVDKKKSIEILDAYRG